VNNTISGNYAFLGGGAVYVNVFFTTITNSVLFGNAPDEILARQRGLATVSYSTVQGGYPGVGNLSSDPLFRDPLQGDFRLRCDSPCVEAGTSGPSAMLPPFDFEGRDLRTLGSIDMGSDEVGLQIDFDGPAKIGGPPVSFTVTAPLPSGLAFVLLSFGSGGQGGVEVPRSGGRALDLDLDPLFNLWLALPAGIRRVAPTGCSGATTLPFSLPSGLPVGLTVYFAGLWIDGAGDVLSVTETGSLVTE
jgi:hypothetical protein